jgi:hypothetical protein
MFLNSNALPVLFESVDSASVLENPVNEAWLAVVNAISGERFEVLERRYYVALYHFRKQRSRPKLPNTIELYADGEQMALQGMLEQIEQGKADRKQAESEGEVGNVLFDALPDSQDETLPEVLRDFSKTPQSLTNLLSGRGRPPCDGLCLMRAFLAAPLLGVGDDPTSVHRLLHSNPTFARNCNFQGPLTRKLSGELTSRSLPSLSVCEEFSEIMTRYGLWNLARQEQVKENIATEALKIEDTISIDTTHADANSHCANVASPEAEAKAKQNGSKPKHRKVPRVCKKCRCGHDQWETCEHPWSPTDQGAAVVVKGPTRVHWAHKYSVVAFAESDIPIDVRVCEYAAEHDGKTLIPHLVKLQRDLPEVTRQIRFILADDAYRFNRDAVGWFGQEARLVVPVHSRRVKPSLADSFAGIDRFTPIGIPVCEGESRFELLGRDITNQRYIWVAPDDDEGRPVCASCPLAETCLSGGQRRHIRVNRKDLPQIDWDHPQHSTRNRNRYKKRTGVERAIKRLKVDLKGERLTHRGVHRAQAHLDRKLLTLHILLAVTNSR